MKKLSRPKHQIAPELSDKSGQMAILMQQASNRRKGDADNTDSNVRKNPAETGEGRSEAGRRRDRKSVVEASIARFIRKYNFERESWKGRPMNVSGSGRELTLSEYQSLATAFLPTGRVPFDERVGVVVAPTSKSDDSDE